MLLVATLLLVLVAIDTGQISTSGGWLLALLGGVGVGWGGGWMGLGLGLVGAAQAERLDAAQGQQGGNNGEA